MWRLSYLLNVDLYKLFRLSFFPVISAIYEGQKGPIQSDAPWPETAKGRDDVQAFPIVLNGHLTDNSQLECPDDGDA